MILCKTPRAVVKRPPASQWYFVDVDYRCIAINRRSSILRSRNVEKILELQKFNRQIIILCEITCHQGEFYLLLANIVYHSLTRSRNDLTFLTQQKRTQNLLHTQCEKITINLDAIHLNRKGVIINFERFIVFI